MKPIALRAPSRHIYAYACGVCHQVPTGSDLMVRLDRPDPDSVAFSKRDAEQCCCCRTCSTPLPEVRHGECESCAAKSRLQMAIAISEREQEDERRETHNRQALGERDPVAAKALCELMSEVSEEAYCAQWLIGLELKLWRFVNDERAEAEHFGFGVAESDLDKLAELHRQCDGWWRWSDEMSGPVFMPTAAWVVMFEAQRTATR